MKYPYIFTVILILSGMLAAPAVHARHFKVYGYNTLKAGEFELVYWTDYVADSDNKMNFFGKTGVERDGLLGHTFEVEYGVTDRLTIAAYLDFEQPSGENLEYIQTRVVAAHYRFGEKGARYFNPAIYVEYYLPDPDYQGSAKEKIEVRFILERDYKNVTLRLNPKLEKVLSGPDVNEGLEFEYGASLYRRRGRIRPGLEVYGSMGELTNFKSSDKQKHYLVPAVKFKLGKRMSWNLGIAFGLTDASDNTVIKSIIEWEL